MIINVLMFCSWLDVENAIGNFFVEQAELITDQYNIILVVFKQEKASIKKFNHRKKSFIIEKRTSKGNLVLEVYYPAHIRYPLRIKDLFEHKALKLLNSYLKTNKVNVSLIHAQSLFDAGLWAYKYFLNYKTSYFITEHNQLSFFNKGEKISQLATNALKNAKKICVVSNDKIRQFIANGLYFDFENIGNLVHERFYYLPKQLGEVKRLITIGAFDFLKDQKTIIRALMNLDKQIKIKVEFVWVGFDGWGGNHKAAVENLFSDTNFENIQIILIPLTDRAGVVNELQQADAFVFSSLSEGMPVSVLEALACGLPVFSSNCGGVDEIINNTNGVIYPIKDSEQLTVLLLDFLNGKMKFNRAEISGDIIKKCGSQAFRNKLIEVYAEII